MNDLIEISRFDSGVAALALNEVDMAELVRATLRTRGWSERVDTELTPAVTARLDPRRVDVILANLVGNALRHGEPPVSVRLSADPHWITLEVRDHGPGLKEAVLPHVLDQALQTQADLIFDLERVANLRYDAGDIDLLEKTAMYPDLPKSKPHWP